MNYQKIRPSQGAVECWEYIGPNVTDVARLAGLKVIRPNISGDPIASSRFIFDCDCEDGQGMERRYLAHGEFLEIWGDCEACEGTSEIQLDVDFFERHEDHPGDYGIWSDGEPLTDDQIRDLKDGAVGIVEG